MREPRKNLVCGNVKCFRLEPQDKKTKVRQLFSYYNYFFYDYDFTDIDECKGNNSNVQLDILGMDETAQVKLIFLL